MARENTNPLIHFPKNSGGTDSETKHPCAGCLHFYGRYHNNKCCNYLFDTGHKRPCPPGEECTVKRPILGEEDLKLRKRLDTGYEWMKDRK